MLQLICHRALRLFNRPRRQPQIDRAAGLVAQPVFLVRGVVGVLLDIVEREAQDHREFVDEGRFERCQPVLRNADQRLRDRLMRTAFGCERDAGRRRHHDEAGILVAGIIQRIESAGDERVVQRADRQQAFALDGMRQAERRQQDEQIHLGDTEFDMLALRREFPGEGGGNALVAEGVELGGARKKPAPVHPGAEIGRDRDVGRGGDDARCVSLLRLADFVHQRPEAGLGRGHGLRRH